MSIPFIMQLFLILSLFAGQMNCSAFAQNRTVKFDESFVMRPKETVVTEDKQVKITMNGVGRKISESGEVEYVELEINLNNSSQTLIISERENRSKSVGKYIIELINAESFGKAHCELKISRNTK